MHYPYPVAANMNECKKRFAKGLLFHCTFDLVMVLQTWQSVLTKPCILLYFAALNKS